MLDKFNSNLIRVSPVQWRPMPCRAQLLIDLFGQASKPVARALNLGPSVFQARRVVGILQDACLRLEHQ